MEKPKCKSKIYKGLNFDGTISWWKCGDKKENKSIILCYSCKINKKRIGKFKKNTNLEKEKKKLEKEILYFKNELKKDLKNIDKIIIESFKEVQEEKLKEIKKIEKEKKQMAKLKYCRSRILKGRNGYGALEFYICGEKVNNKIIRCIDCQKKVK